MDVSFDFVATFLLHECSLKQASKLTLKPILKTYKKTKKAWGWSRVTLRYIYIYIYRERERERENVENKPI
jgi:hypothetical protein